MVLVFLVSGILDFDKSKLEACGKCDDACHVEDYSVDLSYGTYPTKVRLMIIRQNILAYFSVSFRAVRLSD